jgi:transcriptional regulator with XRE-family HTH domain
VKEENVQKSTTPTRSEPTDLTYAVGLRIRALRERAGMTQVELASAVGYKDGTSITFIEQGRNNIKPDVLLLLCTALGTSPNELFGWDEGKK